MPGNTNFEPLLSEMLSQKEKKKENFILLISRHVFFNDLNYYYYILNFVNKAICFLHFVRFSIICYVPDDILNFAS